MLEFYHFQTSNTCGTCEPVHQKNRFRRPVLSGLARRFYRIFIETQSGDLIFSKNLTNVLTQNIAKIYIFKNVDSFESL